MRRKLVTLAVVALFAGCGFPSVHYADDGSEGGTEEASTDGAPQGEGSSGGDATSDGAGGSDGPPSGDTGGTSSGGDASSGSDSTAGDAPHDAIVDVVFEAAPDANPCDKDGDHYIAVSCGGNDCCDTDPNANPGNTAWYKTPDNCGSFDYDCKNGTIEYEYTQNLNCSGLSVTGCKGSGFTGAPGCGGQGPYVSCVVSGLSCGESAATNETQYCQ